MTRHDDEALRRLERRAAGGDPHAQEQLERAKRRTVEPDPWEADAVVQHSLETLYSGAPSDTVRLTLNSGTAWLERLYSHSALARRAVDVAGYTPLGSVAQQAWLTKANRAVYDLITVDVRSCLRSQGERWDFSLPLGALHAIVTQQEWRNPNPRCPRCRHRRAPVEDWDRARLVAPRGLARFEPVVLGETVEVVREHVEACTPCGKAWLEGAKIQWEPDGSFRVVKVTP